MTEGYNYNKDIIALVRNLILKNRTMKCNNEYHKRFYHSSVCGVFDIKYNYNAFNWRPLPVRYIHIYNSNYGGVAELSKNY